MVSADRTPAEFVPGPVRVAAIQHDIAWEDRRATLGRLAPQVSRAAAAGARLVAVTEMFATGFSMRTHLTAEDEDGPIATWMAEQAAAHEVWVAGSVALRSVDDQDKATNSLLVVGPDGERHRYDKIHPFSYAGEHERFSAGQQPVTVAIDGVRWTLTVCYDLRFADLYWQAAEHTDAYLVVANWPSVRRHHWRALLAARAIENQAFVVGVNRVGEGGGIDYLGDSAVIDPAGEVLASAAGSETIVLADVDPSVVSDVRERYPFQRDRR